MILYITQYVKGKVYGEKGDGQFLHGQIRGVC